MFFLVYRKFNHGTTQKSQGEENQKIQGKNSSICNNLIYNVAAYYVSQIGQGYMRLSQERV